MSKHLQIRELQEKAFNGDTEALELYNVFVNKGEAPAINVIQPSKFDTKDIYKDTKEVSMPNMYGDMRSAGHTLNNMEKMMMGYNATEATTIEAGVELQAIKKDNPNERPLSPIEKMSAGYQSIQEELSANQEKYLQEKGGNK